jgi:tRNA A37 threonylcarbamoyladenosine synthetase subunit TsaC/SUA5/YrdC
MILNFLLSALLAFFSSGLASTSANASLHVLPASLGHVIPTSLGHVVPTALGHVIPTALGHVIPT